LSRVTDWHEVELRRRSIPCGLRIETWRGSQSGSLLCDFHRDLRVGVYHVEHRRWSTNIGRPFSTPHENV